MLNTNAESHRAAYTIFLLRTILFLNCFGSSFFPNFMVHLGGTSCQDISICEQVAINSWVPMSDPPRRAALEILWRQRLQKWQREEMQASGYLDMFGFVWRGEKVMGFPITTRGFMFFPSIFLHGKSKSYDDV